ncbi:putative oxidoreductase [Lachnellula suecica]|uniref:Putative oxidoreductase n=1 Tax=Lachnellula suecica TaxID=602035 RepID=A0A8T9C677_9HELO|nr:putative oxidoreductase [Lachnellula suecica]
MASLIDTDGVWLVTGCSSGGLGSSIAKHVHNAGHNIVATARNADSLQYLPDGPKILKLELDVTSQDSIAAAIKATVKRFGRLDVLINNAGYGAMAELEGFPEDDARKQMETLFWGPMRLTRESIRVFREVNPAGQGGTILQTIVTVEVACANVVASSKFALEGLTKGVAKELNPDWNIKLMIVSPGGVKTNFQSNFKRFPRHPAYDNDEAPLTILDKWICDPASSSMWADADKCAAVLFDAVVGQKERPLPMRLNLGAEVPALMRADTNVHLKEIEDWEKETVMVARTADGV